MITVVTGLPRSGTSLMMQVLSAGGIEILSDDVRRPDTNNPRGYFEYERTKSLARDNSWVAEAENKAVKVIGQLVKFLPLEFEYKFVMMERNIDEILVSQTKMIENLGGRSAAGTDALKRTFTEQTLKVKAYLSANPRFKVHTVNYNEMLSDKAGVVQALDKALNLNLNVGSAAAAIDDSLYRNRIAS